jgi:hypothetical protein
MQFSRCDSVERNFVEVALDAGLDSWAARGGTCGDGLGADPASLFSWSETSAGLSGLMDEPISNRLRP